MVETRSCQQPIGPQPGKERLALECRDNGRHYGLSGFRNENREGRVETLRDQTRSRLRPQVRGSDGKPGWKQLQPL